ncbi:PIN domain-containing protein [Wohlfahrtiimonas larvae]|uniref:PIN-like domain-containing protein n=1 Tax=Wohlfahrtiimonas larvae TaxID=1157986 RepID=A0ABP9N002_9GAMM|nr:PIN domain-containing protein [Wohlfahrtiimonas larvae]
MQERSILFIDIENCPSKITELILEFKEYQKVVICYANTNVKIPLDWLTSLSNFVMQGRLELIKMGDTANNSADFGITFMLGCYFEQYDRFEIYSNDKDFDAIINLVNRAPNKKAKRVGTTRSDKELQFDSLLIKMCKMLSKIEDNSRPAKVEGLRNSIRAQLKARDMTDRAREHLVSHVINRMEFLDVVHIKNQGNLVKYNANRMQDFLSKMTA